LRVAGKIKACVGAFPSRNLRLFVFGLQTIGGTMLLIAANHAKIAATFAKGAGRFLTSR
jgi:hypothetical protein